MFSAAQSAANKANAQHSTGPTTEAGKQRTRLNAYKHGLTGHIHLLTAAEQTAFEAHCKSICEALAPVGALEIDIAQAIAEDRWRLKRVRAMETGIFAAGRQGALGFTPSGDPNTEDPEQALINEAVTQARSWLAKSDNFQLLTLYEQRINRTIERNMAELRTLRAERKAAREQVLEEAVLLAQLAQSKGEKYDPAGSYFSPLLRASWARSTASSRTCSRAALRSARKVRS